ADDRGVHARGLRVDRGAGGAAACRAARLLRGPAPQRLVGRRRRGALRAPATALDPPGGAPAARVRVPGRDPVPGPLGVRAARLLPHPPRRFLRGSRRVLLGHLAARRRPGSLLRLVLPAAGEGDDRAHGSGNRRPDHGPALTSAPYSIYGDEAMKSPALAVLAAALPVALLA